MNSWCAVAIHSLCFCFVLTNWTLYVMWTELNLVFCYRILLTVKHSLREKCQKDSVEPEAEFRTERSASLNIWQAIIYKIPTFISRIKIKETLAV